MLTIQPKISTNNNYPKLVSFKAEMSAKDKAENRAYEEKVNFYEDQIRDYDEAINDKHTPEPLKKIMKGFRIISEALLEGWAVAWGASKGSKVIKSSVINTASSEFGKKSGTIFKPLIQGIKKTSKNIATALSNGVKAIKDSKFVKNIGKFFTETAEKMNKNSFGKAIVSGIESIGKGFKYIGNKIAQGWNKLANAFKGENASATYDKVSKGTSKVLGTGAGVAGGYSAMTKAEEKEAREAKKATKEEVDTDPVIDEDYDNGLDAAADDLEDDYDD